MKNFEKEDCQLAKISTQKQLLHDNIRMTIQKGVGGSQVYYEPSAQTEKTVEIGFNLGAPIRSVLYANHKTQPQQSNTGQAHLAYYPGCTGFSEYCNNQSVCYLSFLISIDLFEHFFDISINSVREQMHAQGEVIYTRFSPITADMKLALRQLMLCPFFGTAREIFFEGKMLELTSLLRQIATKPKHGLPENLDQEDQEKMWRAKSILDDNLVSPPSIVALAKRLGVNESKLKNKFRQVHGVTPYRYLADQRLEEARRLLCGRHMNVSEAASAVGYSSLSHFSKIFRTKYGVSPHEYMASSDCIDLNLQDAETT